MILNRNPFELILGTIALLVAIRFGWWMFRQIGKSGYTEFKRED
jgi:hypothetical protein